MSNEYDAIKTAFQKASLYDELIKHDFKRCSTVRSVVEVKRK